MGHSRCSRYLDSRPSSDVAIHRAIYGARPDVLAVVHAHLPVAMALTLAGLVPDPGALPETASLHPATAVRAVRGDGQRGAGGAASPTRSSRARRPFRARSSSSGTVPWPSGHSRVTISPCRPIRRRTASPRSIRPSIGSSSSRCCAGPGATPCSCVPQAALATRGLSFPRPAHRPRARRDRLRGGRHERPRAGRRSPRRLHPHLHRLARHLERHRRHRRPAVDHVRCWWCRSPSASGCWPRSRSAGTPRAATSTRRSRSRACSTAASPG